MKPMRRVAGVVLVAIAMQVGAFAFQVATPAPAIAGIGSVPPECQVERFEVKLTPNFKHLFLRLKLVCNGEDVLNLNIKLFSNPVLLGTARTDANGEVDRVFAIPSSVEPGAHHVVVEVEGVGEFVRPILIGAAGSKGGGGGGLGTTTGAGGGSLSGAGGGGILPSAGAGIFMLFLWAVLLVGTGSMLILAARRRLDWLPVRALSGRLRTRGQRPPALPRPEVPFLDTRGFVPTQSESAPPQASSVTEADLLDRRVRDD